MTHIQAFFYNNPDDYPPIINGSRLLAKEGVSVELLCRDTGTQAGVEYPPSVRIRRVRCRGGSLVQFLHYLVWAVGHGKRGSAAFIGHDMYGLVPARILGALRARPVVYHCHDFVERERRLRPGGRLVRAFEQFFARTCDLVVVPDRERGREMRRSLRLPHDPIIAANAPLASVERGGDALLKALSERAPYLKATVLRQGVIGPGHGLEKTVESMPLWQSPTWGLVLLGREAEGFGDHLREKARRLGVAHRVVFLPPVSYDAVHGYTGGADLGHALYEPIHVNNVHITTASNKLMEYLAGGIPVLVSDRPGPGELVAAHGCGLAVDDESPAAIAEGINKIRVFTRIVYCFRSLAS